MLIIVLLIFPGFPHPSPHHPSNRTYMVAASGWILSSRDSERSDGDEEYLASVLQNQVVQQQ